MRQRLEEKKHHRLLALETLYKSADGSSREYCDAHALHQALVNHGISLEDAREAISWLKAEGLAEQITLDSIKLTHEGVREVESALERPDEGTEHFAPATIHNVNHFYGTVGGVQQGSNNTMNVAQQFNAPAAIIDHFAAIRREVDKLPAEKKNDAIVLVDAMEAEAKKPEPKHVIFSSYATALATLVSSVAPHIPPLLDWIKNLNK